MFKPNELEAIPLEVEQQFKELENRVMADIVRRIKNNSDITRSADWQIYRLKELGKSKTEIKKLIKETLSLSDKEVDSIYNNAINSGYSRDKELYKATGKDFIPFKENKSLQKLITATALQTKDTLKNITQSLGFATRQADGTLKFTELADYYQKTLDGAVFDITSGAFDYNTVLNRVIKEMTNSGLRTVDYASGWSNRVEVASRRAVMTGVNQVTAKINEDNAKKLDTEYFETTWHSGARPEHQLWQGRVYTKEQLQTICGLGEVTGLCGANCYHNYYPFIPGISERTYSDDELAKLNAEENLKRDYNGKSYTKYEALQKQRRLETAMRAKRQEIKLLQEGGADEDSVIASRCRYRALSSEYVRLSESMNLPQRRQRVYGDGLGNIGVGKWKLPTANMAKHREYKGTTWSKTGKKISDKEYNELLKHADEKGIKLISFENFDGDVRLIHEMLDNAETVINDFSELAQGKNKLQIHNSFNMADVDFAETKGKNKIYINNYAFRDKQLLSDEYDRLVKEKWFVEGSSYKSIIYHELGHVVENVYGLSSKKIVNQVLICNTMSSLDYVKLNLSKYAASRDDCKEIISEAFSSIYSKAKNDFALKFYTECVKIISERR